MRDPDLAGLSLEGLGLVDPSTGYLVFSNPALRSLLGCSDPERRDFRSFLPQEWAQEAWGRALEGPEGIPPGPLDVLVKPLEGPPFPAELRLSLQEREGRPFLGLVVRDGRERLRFVLGVSRTVRTRGLMYLAPSLVHRFNNLLGPILGYAETLEDLLEGDSPAREMVEKIGHSARDAARLARLVASLFAEEAETKHGRMDLGKRAASLVELLAKRAQQKKVLFQTEIQEGLWVQGRSNLLWDLLLDLSLGALEACREGDILVFQVRGEERRLEGRMSSAWATLKWLGRPWRPPLGSRPTKVPVEWPFLAASLLGGDLRLPRAPGEPTLLLRPRARQPSGKTRTMEETP